MMESRAEKKQSPFRLAYARWADILKVVIALVLIGVVLSRTSYQQIIALKDAVSWIWLLASFLLYCAMTALKGVQYWALLGRETTFPQTLRIIVIQNTLTNFVANAAGLISYLALFRVEHNVNLRRSGATFLITKMGDMLSIGFFLFVSAFLVWDRIEVLHTLVILLLMGIGAVFIIFWMVVLLRKRFILQIEELCVRLRLQDIGFIQRGLGVLQSLAGQEHAVVATLFLRGTLFSLPYMMVSMLYSFCRVQIFHIPIDFWAVIFIASLMQFVSAIPFQVFGGLGVTEMSLLYLYHLFQVVSVDLSAILVGLRILFYLFNLVVFLYVPLDILAGRFKRSEMESGA
jgi:uncharacterized membrane protein YbhN (UPF0104 family)